jgi:hypothetical protein
MQKRINPLALCDDAIALLCCVAWRGVLPRRDGTTTPATIDARFRAAQILLPLICPAKRARKAARKRGV